MWGDILESSEFWDKKLECSWVLNRVGWSVIDCTVENVNWALVAKPVLDWGKQTDDETYWDAMAALVIPWYTEWEKLTLSKIESYLDNTGWKENLWEKFFYYAATKVAGTSKLEGKLLTYIFLADLGRLDRNNLDESLLLDERFLRHCCSLSNTFSKTLRSQFMFMLESLPHGYTEQDFHDFRAKINQKLDQIR